MLQAGRKSPHAAQAQSLDIGHRPEPPDYLTDEEQTQWRKIVARMPGGWFTDENLPMLECLVTQIRVAHICQRKMRLITAKKLDESHERRKLADLMKTHNKAANLIMSLSGRMRLSQQARLRPTHAEKVIKERSSSQPARMWG